MLSLGTSFNDTNPQLFPIDAQVITAYWTTPGYTRIVQKVIEYGVVQSGDIVNNVKEFLSSQNVMLDVKMVLTAVWTGFTCLQVQP